MPKMKRKEAIEQANRAINTFFVSKGHHSINVLKAIAEDNPLLVAKYIEMNPMIDVLSANSGGSLVDKYAYYKYEQVIADTFNKNKKDGYMPAKIRCIKEVRSIAGLGLKEAKTLVDYFYIKNRIA